MATDITLRPAERRDIGQIKSIILSSLNEYKITLPDDYSLSDIDSIPSNENSSHAFVLLKHSSVIGCVVIQPISRKGLELKRLYLAKAERGKGLGIFLLDRIIHYARRHGYHFIQLETTSKFYKAVRLYIKFGFVETDISNLSPGHDLAFIKTL